MATTTNYGWATPDDTDLVKDGAAAIRTLGTSIDTSFAADEGDLLVGGTNDIFEALAIGAAGTVLTSDGDTAEWAAPAGGGKVLQVVSATHSTSVSSSTNTFVTTGLNCDITPSSASSKVLVLFTISGANKQTGNTQTRIAMKLQRVTTDIQIIGDSILYQNANSALYDGTISSSYLDSPATTSTTNYRVVFSSPENTASVQVQGSNANSVSSMVLLEIGA
jgi:hypothetical protein